MGSPGESRWFWWGSCSAWPHHRRGDTCALSALPRQVQFGRSNFAGPSGAPDADLDLFVLLPTGVRVVENQLDIPNTTSLCPIGGLQATLAGQDDPVAFAVVDVNRDGLPDVVILNRDAGTLSTYLASPTPGAYTGPLITNIGPNAVDLAPVQLIPGAPVGLAMVSFPSTSLGGPAAAGATPVPGRLTILQGDGAGRFTTHQALPPSCGANATLRVTAGDFNRDGRGDVGCSLAAFAITPTVTPTARVGGRSLTAQGGVGAPVRLAWRPGQDQTGYLVIRWDAVSGAFAFLPQFDQLLTAGITQYVDNGPLPSATYCYVLLIVQGNPPSINQVIGLSDLICVYPGHDAGNPPPNFALRLDDGTRAHLSWTAPGGQDRYELTALRFDGSPMRTFVLSPQVTSFVDETSTLELPTGASSSYQVRALNGAANELGRTDTLCAAPGISAVPTGGSGRGFFSYPRS